MSLREVLNLKRSFLNVILNYKCNYPLNKWKKSEAFRIHHMLLMRTLDSQARTYL